MVFGRRPYRDDETQIAFRGGLRNPPFFHRYILLFEFELKMTLKHKLAALAVFGTFDVMAAIMIWNGCRFIPAAKQLWFINTGEWVPVYLHFARFYINVFISACICEVS